MSTPPHRHHAVMRRSAGLHTHPRHQGHHVPARSHPAKHRRPASYIPAASNLRTHHTLCCEPKSEPPSGLFLICKPHGRPSRLRLRLRCAYAWGGGAGQQVVCYSGITKTRAVIGHPLTPPPGCSTASYVLLRGRRSLARSLLTYTVMCNAGGPVAGERKVKRTHGREKEVSDVGLDRGGEGEEEKECGI